MPSEASNCFIPVKKQIEGHDYIENDIVHYERYDKLVYADEKDPTSFIVVEDVRESERFDRHAYIESFRDEVGIENILKKMAITGDDSLKNQINRHPIMAGDGSNYEALTDITALAGGEEAAAQLGDVAMQIYANLPKDLTDGMSFAQFCDTIDQNKLNAYIQAHTNKTEGEEK